MDYYLTEGRESLQIEMEAIREKMASLRVALEESQETIAGQDKKGKRSCTQSKLGPRNTTACVEETIETTSQMP